MKKSLLVVIMVVCFFSAVSAETSPNIMDFGAGVYYFPQTETDFGKALAQFLSVHTNLEVVALTGNVIRQNRHESRHPYSGDYGVANGYFVIFREKEKK